VARLKVKLKEIAEAKGISQTRLSRLADTNYKTIHAIWLDPYREVTTTTLQRLARALGVSVAELIEEVPDE
jgi:DNA-binding Xre family transcriptional regulator